MFFNNTYITGILTEDVFKHALSYDNKTCTIYINEHAITFKPHEIAELNQRFKSVFGVLIGLKLNKKTGKTSELVFQSAFKVVESSENGGVTKFSFLYKRGKEIFMRNITRPSDYLIGFSSAGVTMNWFRINETDDFIIIPETVMYFYDTGYFPSVDYSITEHTLESLEENDNGETDYSFKIDDDLGF